MYEPILSGTSVLLLEDDALINLNTADMMADMGCVVRPFYNLHEAMANAAERLPDVAVLDVKIEQQMSYHFAEWLHDRRVPIVFLTGYDTSSLQEKWRQHPKCLKPCDAAELRELLIAALTAGRDGKLAS